MLDENLLTTRTKAVVAALDAMQAIATDEKQNNEDRFKAVRLIDNMSDSMLKFMMHEDVMRHADKHLKKNYHDDLGKLEDKGYDR